MKNLFLSDDMSERESRLLKEATCRLFTKSADGRPRPRFRQDDVVYFGEALVRAEPTILIPYPHALYRRDRTVVGGSPGTPDGVEWRWQRRVLPGRFCPAVCARRFGRVTSVAAILLRRIMDSTVEKVLEGFPLDDGTTFEQYWERLHGAPPKRRTWVWHIRWKSLSYFEAWNAVAA